MKNKILATILLLCLFGSLNTVGARGRAGGGGSSGGARSSAPKSSAPKPAPKPTPPKPSTSVKQNSSFHSQSGYGVGISGISPFHTSILMTYGLGGVFLPTHLIYSNKTEGR
jgi:hypothetical protein